MVNIDAVRAFADKRSPALAGLYRTLRGACVRLCCRTPVLRAAFRRYRRRRAARFWADVWFAGRDAGPSALAEESFWQYFEELGCDRQRFEGKVVVDVACGPRNSLGAFEARLKIGVEPTAVAVGRRLLSERGVDLADHDMLYLAAEAEKLPLADGLADVVLCVNALDHLDRPARALREMARVLKKGGELLMSLHEGRYATVNEPNPFTLPALKRELASAALFDYEVERRVTPRPGSEHAPFQVGAPSPQAPRLFVHARKR